MDEIGHFVLRTLAQDDEAVAVMERADRLSESVPATVAACSRMGIMHNVPCLFKGIATTANPTAGGVL